MAMTDHDWREIAVHQGVRMRRQQMALQILRCWNSRERRSAAIAAVVHRWIDAGMHGPLPWPDDPAFGRWAARKGFSNVHGHVGDQLLAASPGPLH